MSEAQASHPTLSAVVMVYNERRSISRCVAALGFCDDVVVVDDGSTDGTWEVVQTLPVRAVQHRHTTLAAQRELGRSLAKGEWVLTLDADEVVTPRLAREIRQRIQRPDAPDGFYVRRRNPYPCGLVGYYMSKHPRLVRADRCRWLPVATPHSPLDVRGLSFRTLRAPLEHEPVDSVATALRKTVNRSLWVADCERMSGRRTGTLRALASALWRFLRFYVGHGGFRFGAHGAVMAGLWAFEALTKHWFLMLGAPGASDGGSGSAAPPVEAHESGKGPAAFG